MLEELHNRRFTQPTEEELDRYMTEHFGNEPTPDSHDPTNPEHVTRELMKPFPQSALYQREGFTYVQYQQVIRRLIYATGNNFQTRVLRREERPWGQTRNGNETWLVTADVELSIPVLNSTRGATGVQVVTRGYGEDMYKGAVSDAIKKAAQQFGVAIDLAGADGEDTAPNPGATTAENEMGTPGPRPAPARQSAPPRATQPHQQRPSAGPSTGKRGMENPRTDQQGKALWKISGANRDVIAEWCAEYGVTSDRDLTEAQAAEIITKYGGPR